MKQLPEKERPRERLIHGGEEQLSDAELLGIIIRDGTRKDSAVDVARKLLSKYGNFRELGAKTISELCKIEGIGQAKAAQIKASIAIAKRYSTITLKPGVKFTNSKAIFNHFHEKLRDKKQETFLIVLLDNKNRIIKEKEISTGSLTASIVHPREVFGPAIREHAASVVFVHNHPSGDPSPSNEDIEITKRLKEVSGIVGIRILDHVIIGNAEYVSFKDDGLI
ncbi:MAG: RadC family protein [Candidatus Anammoxibacter sp.]